MNTAEVERSNLRSLDTSHNLAPNALLPIDSNEEIGYQQSIQANKQSSRFYYTVGSFNILLDRATKVENLEHIKINIIPHAPDWCSGIVNVRGIIMPVVNLHTLLKTGIDIPVKKSKQIMLEHKNLPPIIFLIDTLPKMISMDDYDVKKQTSESPDWQVKTFSNDSGNILYEVNHSTLLNQLKINT